MFEKLFSERFASGTQQPGETSTDRPLRGRILEGATDIGQELYVFVETLGENARRGPCVWAPIIDAEGRIYLPSGGEDCIVQFDENSLPWIVLWVPAPDSEVRQASVPLVTALPAEPYDGQVVNFQNASMAGQGVVWALRYRAASVDANGRKWECIGGSDYVIYGAENPVHMADSGAASTIAALASPQLATPLGGIWEIALQASVVYRKGEVASVQMTVFAVINVASKVGVGTVPTSGLSVLSTTANPGYWETHTSDRTSDLASGTNIGPGIQLGGAHGELDFYGITMRIKPVKVS